jgi:hypothetical protein
MATFTLFISPKQMKSQRASTEYDGAYYYHHQESITQPRTN